MYIYSVWFEDVWYGEYIAKNAWDACLQAADGIEVEAEMLSSLFLGIKE